MLSNKKHFEEVEKTLKEQGILDKYISEEGDIIGRMMITIGEVPRELDIPDEQLLSEKVKCFLCTYDFYDAEVGVLLDIETMTVKSGIWITPQKENYEEPNNEWIEFFIKTLAENIDSKGFGYPMCTFIFNQADITIVPTL